MSIHIYVHLTDPQLLKFFSPNSIEFLVLKKKKSTQYADCIQFKK